MRICYLILLIFSISALNAQHNHSHGEESEHKEKEPPHNGEVVDAGKYHIEITFDAFAGDEKLTVWILNSNYKSKHPKNATAIVKLNYKNNVIIEKEMTNSGDRFYCNVDDVSKPFNAIIIIKVNNKSYGATYFYKGLNK